MQPRLCRVYIYYNESNETKCEHTLGQSAFDIFIDVFLLDNVNKARIRIYYLRLFCKILRIRRFHGQHTIVHTNVISLKDVT